MDIGRRGEEDPVGIGENQGPVGHQRTENLALIAANVTGQQARCVGRQGYINGLILGDIKRTEINNGIIGRCDV